MADLLFEFWCSEFEGNFSRVSKEFDASRAEMPLDTQFVFEVRASSWREAMRLYEERAYGEFGKSYDHFPDIVFTEAEAAEQQSYLKIRGSRPSRP
jgi:hypothetical protein